MTPGAGKRPKISRKEEMKGKENRQQARNAVG